MQTIDKRTIDDINSSITFVELVLKHQNGLPHYATGWAAEEHNKIPNFKSYFKCSITFKNTTHVFEEKDSNICKPLVDMAEIVVDDNLTSDVLNVNYKKGLVLLTMTNYTHSITRNVEIKDETFEITVTYERKYEKLYTFSHLKRPLLIKFKIV